MFFKDRKPIPNTHRYALRHVGADTIWIDGGGNILTERPKYARGLVKAQWDAGVERYYAVGLTRMWDKVTYAQCTKLVDTGIGWAITDMFGAGDPRKTHVVLVLRNGKPELKYGELVEQPSYPLPDNVELHPLELEWFSMTFSEALSQHYTHEQIHEFDRDGIYAGTLEAISTGAFKPEEADLETTILSWVQYQLEQRAKL